MVLGNHDLWEKNYRSLFLLKHKILEKLKSYDITYLPHDPIMEKDFNIYGFDSWYGNPNPPSVDLEYIPYKTEGIRTHDYLKKLGLDQLDMIPDRGGRYWCGENLQIVVTHFDFLNHPMSGDIKWLDILNKKCDVLCVGHSHQRRYDTIMDMRIINCGSDYDKPNAIFLYGKY
jgi:hypothetical protein